MIFVLVRLLRQMAKSRGIGAKGPPGCRGGRWSSSRGLTPPQAPRSSRSRVTDLTKRRLVTLVTATRRRRQRVTACWPGLFSHLTIALSEKRTIDVLDHDPRLLALNRPATSAPRPRRHEAVSALATAQYFDEAEPPPQSPLLALALVALFDAGQHTVQPPTSATQPTAICATTCPHGLGGVVAARKLLRAPLQLCRRPEARPAPARTPSPAAPSAYALDAAVESVQQRQLPDSSAGHHVVDGRPPVGFYRFRRPWAAWSRG